MRHFLTILYMLASTILLAQYTIADISDTAVKESLRGLCAVNDSVVWVSGSHGFVGRSTNAGKSWSWSHPENSDKLDFRSIYAFDKQKAVIANAGFPACIFTTNDGGKTWRKVLEKKDSSWFFDGIGFWENGRGFIYGDPIKGKMLQLATSDSGNTWDNLFEEQAAPMHEGEASFAASGTCIRLLPKAEILIASGGKSSRIFHSKDGGHQWAIYKTPILQSEPSQGIFSFAIAGKRMIIVGGDYTKDTLKKDHVFYGSFPGKKFKKPDAVTGGYRSCVEFINAQTALATGPGGTDISFDAGKHWKLMSKQGFHALRLARKGKTVFFSGSKGRIGRYIPG